jgi:hypothetical protein
VDATGVGPGFSGSPIYCDDGRGTARNAGAISESLGEYGGEIVLATPIEAILGIAPDAPGGRSERGQPARPRGSTGGAKPLATPLTVSGVSATLGRALEAAGRRAGRPGARGTGGPAGLVPAATDAAGRLDRRLLLLGDIQVGAVGTVAYTDADRVWAFGHPFEEGRARRLLLQDATSTASSTTLCRLGRRRPAPTNSRRSVTRSGTIANDGSVRRRGAARARCRRPSPSGSLALTATRGRELVTGIRAADESRIGLPRGASPVSFIAPLARHGGATRCCRARPAGCPPRSACRSTLSRARAAPPASATATSPRSPPTPTSSAPGTRCAARASSDLFDALARSTTTRAGPPRIDEVAVKHGHRARRAARVPALRQLPRRVRAGPGRPCRRHHAQVRGGHAQAQLPAADPLATCVPRRRYLRFVGTDVDLGRGRSARRDLLPRRGRGRGGNPGLPSLRALARRIRSLARYDGVRVYSGDSRAKAFRDSWLRVSGRASARVRVVRR